MPVLAIPNVSEGRSRDLLTGLSRTLTQAGAHVLDVHSDADHNRSVFTIVGDHDTLVRATARLAEHAASAIDLGSHKGVHPRLGALDVCPFVPHETEMELAVATAREAAAAINEAAGIPVYLYGEAARRTHAGDLPDLRRGGLEALAQRALSDLPPDFGSNDIDLRRGVVCVGARRTLIAFNVNLAAPIAAARAIAAQVRGSSGGLPGVRALGLAVRKRSQVSMNLTDPDAAGIDLAFDAVEKVVGELGVEVVSTEIVGLVPERYLPNPDAKAARLLIEPGRSLETALRR